MVSVITGDIINSRNTKASSWLRILKKELSRLGESPRQWEIYRGDSFQLEVKNPKDALQIAIHIKAAIKSVKGVDVRIAIGIGEKSNTAKSITESNGSAFVRSGELFEELKKLKVNLAVRSNNEEFNTEINLYLRLALVIMDRWTMNASQTIRTIFDNPDRSQEDLGKILKVKQNAVSTRLKRACYYEIRDVIDMYNLKIGELK